MKILFYRYGSICEPDLIEEFQRIGLEVDIIEGEISNKNLTNQDRVDLITQALDTSSYAFVFNINFYPVISDVCQIYHIPYVTWIVDSPLVELFSKAIQNPCNRVFCFDRKQYQDICEYNPDCIYHLPLATNVTRWDNVISSISDADRKKYSADISFIGSLYTEKDPYREIKSISPYTQGFVDALMNSQFQIQGYNTIDKALTDKVINDIKKAIPLYFNYSFDTVCDISHYVAAHHILDMHCSSLERNMTLKRLSEDFKIDLYTASDTSFLKNCSNISLKGTAKTLTEMPKIFNLSKINLNLTIHAIETGASLRIWDVLGCGGFLLSNFQEELVEYLEPGVDFDYFTSLDELVDKCHFYLEHEDIRKTIASNGYEKVKKYHNYTNRMPQIISSIMK